MYQVTFGNRNLLVKTLEEAEIIASMCKKPQIYEVADKPAETSKKSRRKVKYNG